ncbi:MAG: MBL fold metallo-hydrolase [Desulfurococcales archaeon]|nr:MBL fold metallo-hydrolase [Desulfurococcales archaeon]
MLVRVEAWLPIPGLGSVNVYAFTDGVDTILVDAGMYHARSFHTLLKGLRRSGVEPKSISRVIITHYHVDHLTGALLVAEAFGAEVYMGARDVELVTGVGVEGYVKSALELFRTSGVPSSVVEEIVRYHPGLRLIEAYKAVSELDIKPLRGDDMVEMPGLGVFTVVDAPGHTPGHIILVSGKEKVVIAGDTILPGITPHVSLHTLDSDPLKDYIDTLEMIASRLKGFKALPGHRTPIPDAAARALELIEHHKSRLREVEDIVARLGSPTAFEVAVRVTWSGGRKWEDLTPPEKYFALAETLAHLKRLESLGRLEARWKSVKGLGTALTWTITR